MDLIANLASTLGVEDNAAQALAGAVLANVKGAVEEDTEGTEVEEKLAASVPEMGGWLDAAKALAGAEEPKQEEESGGMLGGLMDMAGSGVGNQLLGAVAGKKAQNAALLAAVLGKVGLDESKAMMAAPLVLQFLESRMDKAMLDKILAVAPILTGATPPAPKPSGVMGALGGLLG